MFCWSYTEHCWRCCQTPFFQPLKHVAPQWKRKLPFGSSSTDTLLRKHWKLCVQKKKKKTICSFVSSARADLVSIRICISSFAFAPCAALQQSQHWFFTCGPFFLLLTTILLSLSLSRFLDTIAAASMEALLVNSATAAKASSACVASPTVSRQLVISRGSIVLVFLPAFLLLLLLLLRDILCFLFCINVFALHSHYVSALL